MYLCYCLVQRQVVEGRRAAGRAATYVGCTNNFARRIRQHNGEIVGGARCTTRACAAGAVWVPLVFARGFVDNHEALSFEWHWKRASRRIKAAPQQKRLRALDELLARPRFAHIRRDAPSNSAEPHPPPLAGGGVLP